MNCILPYIAIPLRYNISLNIDDRDLTYSSEVIIEISIIEKTTKILLNAYYSNYKIQSIKANRFDKIIDNWTDFKEVQYKDSEEVKEAIEIQLDSLAEED